MHGLRRKFCHLLHPTDSFHYQLRNALATRFVSPSEEVVHHGGCISLTSSNHSRHCLTYRFRVVALVHSPISMQARL